MIMRILVTGFEPFGGDDTNASGTVVARLAQGWSNSSAALFTAVLPVEFDRAPRSLEAAIAAVLPVVVICLGEAGGRSEVTPERWAGPTADARIPDNAGNTPSHKPLDSIVGHLSSRIDVDAMVSSIRAAGVPATVSEDAGRFVCNATFRALLRDHDMPAGFIHLPAVRETGVASVGAETDASGFRTAGPELGHDELVRAVSAVLDHIAAH